jgi:hypothetical protein
VHYDVVEGDVWHTTPEMLNRKYRKSYRMNFLAFEHLVSELTPFLRPTADMFVWPPVPVRKQVSLVVYRLAQGLSCKAMDNLYGCEASTLGNIPLLFVEYFLRRRVYSGDIFTHLLDTDLPILSVNFVNLPVCLT